MKKLRNILTFTQRGIALVMCLTIVLTGTAYAQEFDSGFTEQDLKDINNQTPWYGPSIDGCTIEGGPGTFTGDNVKDAFLYFMDPGRGLTAVQSAGIVGNLIQESGVNPRSNQAGGPGMGIAQWSEGGRWEALKKWVADNNKGDPFSLGAQLDFLWHEMTEVAPWNETLPVLRGVVVGGNITDGDVIPSLRSYLNKPGGSPFSITTDAEAVAAATVVFERKFEKAGIPNIPRRVQNAKMILERFGSLAPASAGTTASGTVPAGGDTGLCGGEAGQGNVDASGMSWPVGDQKKHSYGTAPCKSRTCHHDGTPAFDLMFGPNGNMDGRPVYAITAGTIQKQGIYHGVTGCYSIQFRSDLGNGKGPYFYWYGHLQNPKYATGDHVEAGKQIAEVGRYSLGSDCRGGRDHLHIDRGCVPPGSKPQTGGGKSCRDSAFVGIINTLWEALPE